jgi:hypothetical protein
VAVVPYEVRTELTVPRKLAAVRAVSTPQRLSTAYAALEQWCATSSRPLSGTSWEVYGGWDDDPAGRRTDVYLLL